MVTVGILDFALPAQLIAKYRHHFAAINVADKKKKEKIITLIGDDINFSRKWHCFFMGGDHRQCV